MPKEKFNLIPPEIEFMSAKYILSIPVTDKHLKDPWKLRLLAAKRLERKLGDQIELTNLKVQKPGFAERTRAKLRHEVPFAHLHVTIKF